MQGTGTQADPYQITSVDELIEYAKKDDVYLKIMNDIDFNNYSGWMLPTIDVRCFEIDGDGHSLNNIYIKNASLFNVTDKDGLVFSTRTSTFKNMTMEIIQIGNAPIFAGYEHQPSKFSKYIQLLDCDIRIKSYPTNTIFILFNTAGTGGKVFINIRRSIINIDAYGCGYGICLINSVDTSANSTIEYSEIQVNIYNGNNASLNPLIGRVYIDNVAIFVNMDKINNNSNYNLFSYTTLTNSYVIAKQDNLQVMSWGFDSSTTFLSTCFYNKDYSNLPAVSNLHALTTDQCKSVSKLTELGFVVS